MKKINVLLIALLTSIVFVTVGCSSDESSGPETSSESQNTAPSRDRTIRREAPVAELPPPSNEDPAKRIPRRAGQTESEGFGLTLMVDGSSPEAFADSLELIASDSSPEQYRQLDSALRYLQVYSSDGWSGLPGFYERLNGMTGEEIIQRAQRLQQERRGG